MDSNILRSWAKFQKLDSFEKRKLFSNMIAEDTAISCEWRISRILTRLTFKEYKDLHKIQHPEDRLVRQYIDELSISPSTVENWYYDTKKEHLFQKNSEKCENCRFSSACFGNIESAESIIDKYGYGLLSMRMYLILVKADKFKGLLSSRRSDAEIRRGLRGLVHDCYYSKKPRVHSSEEEDYLQALARLKIKAMTALRWFYLIKNSSEIMDLAKANEVSPSEAIIHCMRQLKHEVHSTINDLEAKAI